MTAPNFVALRQKSLSLEEIATAMPMAMANTDCFGRCYIHLSVDQVFSLKKFSQLLHRLDHENQQRDGSKKRACLNIIDKTLTLQHSSEALYEKKYHCLTRLFSCCLCCPCIELGYVSNLLRLKKNIENPPPKPRENTLSSVVLSGV